ncbi:MAG: WecB/TagA/CpsF family glycosyltransferase [Candidatus Omnitrophica bacterium]|nr:WecB/TagA/CpsF family glycosyltransferase [Candidatus Omnitrophota bacterium]
MIAQIPEIIDFLGLRISAVTREQIVGDILESALKGRRRLITYINAHCVNLSFEDSEYRQILNRADLVYADGKSIVRASRLLNNPLPERVNILDFFDRLAVQLKEKNVKIYLLGAESGVVRKAAERLSGEPFGLRISGFHHGFFTPSEEGAIIDEINRIRPDMLMVGMGVPRQEKWLRRHLQEMDVNLCWAVGSAFEWLSGYRKRAPEWMLKHGLEWFYRLCLEPKRLWRRYLIGNFIFIYYVLKWKIKRIFSP